MNPAMASIRAHSTRARPFCRLDGSIMKSLRMLCITSSIPLLRYGAVSGLNDLSHFRLVSCSRHICAREAPSCHSHSMFWMFGSSLFADTRLYSVYRLSGIYVLPVEGP